MILLTTLLVFLLTALAAIIIRVTINPTWPWFNRVIAMLLIVSLALGVVTIVGSATYNGIAKNIQEQHDTIMLYYDTINNCRNEYVRFDFYTRVQDYNTEYLKTQEKAEDIWFGKLFPSNWNANCNTIDFELCTGAYNG
jgi:predicted PurR-regulated permease PerM